MKMTKINLEMFEAWLLSQPATRKVRLGDTHDCLMCMFLKENTSISRPLVGFDTYGQQKEDDQYKEESGTVRKLPKWFKSFFFKIYNSSYDDYHTFRRLQSVWREMNPDKPIKIEPIHPIQTEPLQVK